MYTAVQAQHRKTCGEQSELVRFRLFLSPHLINSRAGGARRITVILEPAQVPTSGVPPYIRI